METMQYSSTVPKCAIICLSKNPVDFPMWLKYHRDLGIVHFFIRLEDSVGWEDYLKTQKDITYELGVSGVDNYNTLQDRQIVFVNKMIPAARSQGIEWVFHIDTDELLEGDLGILHTFGSEVKWAKIQNVEAIFDGTEKTCFGAKHFLKCKEGARCRSYVNGKSVGRTEVGVTLKGPHDFQYDEKNDKKNTHVEIEFDKLHLLHFESCSFGAWAEKYKNLSGNQSNKKIPFPYYNASIDASIKAYEVYQKSVMPDISTIDKKVIYQKKNIF